MTTSVKVVVVGPQRCGKSYLADFLSDEVTPGEERDYFPTRGCRIVTVDANAFLGGRKGENFTVELWDVSGKDAYENVWLALADEADGAIVVFDGTKPDQGAQLTKWFRPFIKNAGIKTGQCAVFANNPFAEEDPMDEINIEGPLSKATLFRTDIANDPEGVRDAFSALLKGVRQAVLAKREREEDKMLNV